MKTFLAIGDISECRGCPNIDLRMAFGDSALEKKKPKEGVQWVSYARSPRDSSITPPGPIAGAASDGRTSPERSIDGYRAMTASFMA
ncbi:MAG: hypothetical protein K6F46_12465 [Desulfovibrio sp.]|nr:hypothetical protein [Desulfovibrio sp.]